MKHCEDSKKKTYWAVQRGALIARVSHCVMCIVERGVPFRFKGLKGLPHTI